MFGLKEHMKKILLTLSFVLLMTAQSFAATYIVRKDGGTDLQCLGTTDAAYPGSGTNQACAFKHLSYTMPYRGSGATGYVSAHPFVGGDTVIVTGGAGIYNMAAGQVGCSNAVDCEMRVPGGPDAAHPTRILGKGWDTETGTRPVLVADGSIFRGILDFFDGVDNIQVQYIDFTDGEDCMQRADNGGTLSPKPCSAGHSGAYGIYARATTGGNRVDNVLIKNVRIHGMSKGGIQMAGTSNWTFDNVEIRANGLFGLNGDEDDGAYTDSQAGTHTGTDLSITYTGCSENSSTYALTKCFGQAGEPEKYYDGQGDALVIQGDPVPNWNLINFICSYNGADCIDALHGVGGGFLKILGSLFAGNTGQVIKSANALTLENSIVVGDCAALFYSPYAINDLTHGSSISNCRAGSVMALLMNPNVVHRITNTTIFSNADIGIYATGSCNANSKVVFRNSIFYGARDFLDDSSVPGIYRHTTGGNNENSALYYSDGSGCPGLDADYNIYFNTKNGSSDSIGAHSYYGNPGFTGTIKTGPSNTVGYWGATPGEESNFYLGPTSQARFTVRGANTADETLTSGTGGDLAKDYNYFARGSAWDTGALEFGSVVAGGGETCSDGIRNQNEVGIDCGGVCPACQTCSDGIQNQNETGVDCGGVCSACPTCSDGIKNQGETAIDCGGPCALCIACGNNTKQTGEVCDGTDLNSQTCQTQGFQNTGGLACAPDCHSFNTAACIPIPSCGNNTKESGETCDGTDLNAHTCQTEGFQNTAGLACSPNCLSFVTAACTPISTCGNNTKEGAEFCDGTAINGQNCTTIGQGFDGGILHCNVGCTGYDTSSCTTTSSGEGFTFLNMTISNIKVGP